MSPALLCIICFAAATIITHIFVCLGIIRCRSYENRVLRCPQSQTRPTVSVLIPARNEETQLPRLLQSLEKQTMQQFEIVLINDRSTDGTGDIMEEFKRRYPSRIKLLHLENNPQKVNPKQYALLQGVNICSGEVILFTDADCLVPTVWVEHILRFFADDDVGLVFGPVYTAGGSGFLTKYQTFDHVFRYYYTAGCAGMGLPTGGFGNNLAVRNTILEAIGGYESIGYTVTEDAALIASIRKKTSCRVIALTDRKATVVSTPHGTWRELRNQQMRWSSGAFFSPDIPSIAGYSAVMIFLAGGFIAPLLLPIFPPAVIVTCSTVVSMLSVGVSGGICSRMKGDYWFSLLPSIVVSGFFYSYVNILSLIKTPLRWKGDKLYT